MKKGLGKFFLERKVVEDYVTILEVDFVLYGERGLHAFEVKRAARLRGGDYDGLRAFVADYPMATCTLAYSGTKRFTEGAIEVVPIDALLTELPERQHADLRHEPDPRAKPIVRASASWAGSVWPYVTDLNRPTAPTSTCG